MRSASDSTLPGNSLKYTRIDLALSEILVLFSRRKCGWGRTAKVTTLSNSHGYMKPKLLDTWKQTIHNCELLSPRFPSLKSDSFPRIFKPKSLPELLLRESRAKHSFCPLKGELSHVLQ